MLQFNVDDAIRDSCQVCCCEQVALRPGTTSRLTINYAPWAVPIGRLHCEPQFALEQMAACGIISGAPVKVDGANVAFDVPSPPLNEDFNTKIVDPDGGTLTFKSVPFYGPKHGVVSINTDGTFTYTPQGGYNGPDRFYITATDETDKTSTFEVLIGVGSYDSEDMVETPHVSVESWTVNYQHYFVNVAIKVAPNADQCEVWRLTSKMNAIDCDCVCYDKIDCFDIRMSKC
jgi:VCBS repeat-containing protein